MARPNDLVVKTDVTLKVHPEHAGMLGKLAVGGSMGAGSVAELITRMVSAVLSQGGKLDISDEMNRILSGESEQKTNLPE